IASSIGLAIPADRSTYGYLSEHHSFGEPDNVAGEYAEELAAEMLATTLNVEFDPDKSWDEKKEIYRISNKIVRTTNITQTAMGDKRGLWTTVIASAILIFDQEAIRLRLSFEPASWKALFGPGFWTSPSYTPFRAVQIEPPP